MTGLNIRAKAVYFELRDAEGAVRCSMWRNDFDAQEIPEGALRDGSEVVIGGGPEYYPGSATASPSFSFRATRMRLAGEGDLLAQLAALASGSARRACSSRSAPSRCRASRGRSA